MTAKILIVDDNAQLLRGIKPMVKRAGFVPELVESAEAALEALHRGSFDVIVSDHSMPGMGGVELLKKARELAPGTTRVLMTGLNKPDVLQDAINEAGVFRYVVKPFQSAEFITALKAAVEASTQSKREGANDFGKYELLERIAVGGMAEVHLARLNGMASFSKKVVIKIMLPNLAQEVEFNEMFVDEARLVAHLTHPNIAQVFEMGKTQGRYFIAMEYVDGETLAAVQKRGGNALPIDVVVPATLQLLDALEYAHDLKGQNGEPLKLVHRDISPANVMLGKQGHVKLVDFGIAKTTSSLHQTEAGVVKGKLSYLSPEQVEGKTLDRRSDLFSVGTMLYHLISGKRPFFGTDQAKVMLAIREGRYASLQSLMPSVPVALCAVVTRAMAVDPAKRFQNASEFREALAAVARQLNIAADAGSLSRALAQVGKTLESSAEGLPAVPLAAAMAAAPAAPAPAPVLSAAAEAPELLSASFITEVPADAPTPTIPPPAGTKPAPKKRRRMLAGVTGALGLMSIALVAVGAMGATHPSATAVSAGAATRLAVAPKAAPSPVADALPALPKKEKAQRVGRAASRALPQPELEAPKAPTTGTLRVTSNRPAKVMMNGKAIARTPAAIQLTGGIHQLTVVDDATGVEQPVSVDITAGFETDVNVDLRDQEIK